MNALDFIPVYENLDATILVRYPELKTCTSATEASRVIFGVRTMTKFIGIDYYSLGKIMFFFKAQQSVVNHSDMISWSKHAIPTKGIGLSCFVHRREVCRSFDFYKKIAKNYGLSLAVLVSQNDNFTDILRGFEFMWADKKRLAQFEKNIISALPFFPNAVHASMVHDYCVEEMTAFKKLENIKESAVPSLPEFSMVPTEINGYKVFVPRTPLDLRDIGKAQRHCVGTKEMGYADKIKDNKVCVVAIYRKKLGDGICVEFDISSMSNPQKSNYLDSHVIYRNALIIQAQGRLRRVPTGEEYKVMDEVLSLLLSSFGSKGSVTLYFPRVTDDRC